MLVGAVPAAGRAERLQPLTGSKELLPVDGRPVMDYVIEHMWAARAEEVRVVTRPDKVDVIERARALGANVIAGEPPTSAESVLLAGGGLAADDILMIGFPDTVWRSDEGFERVVSLVEGGAEVGLGLFRGRNEAQLRRSDVVVLDGERVVALQVKPDRPGSTLLWGCAAARRRAVEGLTGRRHPGELFADLADEGEVAGVVLDGDFFDIGTPASLAEAQA
jgi:NDP-sugar pyrophosphorylase family protein